MRISCIAQVGENAYFQAIVSLLCINNMNKFGACCVLLSDIHIVRWLLYSNTNANCMQIQANSVLKTQPR